MEMPAKFTLVANAEDHYQLIIITCEQFKYFKYDPPKCKLYILPLYQNQNCF